MEKMTNLNMAVIPATIMGKTIVQAFFENVQTVFIYSTSFTCFVVVSSQDSCSSLALLP
jgi:hypothetical protein